MAKKKVRNSRANAPARPASKYQARFADEARALCFVGATNKGLADYFGVSEATVERWAKKHRAFAEALREKRAADDRVVNALYKRALGFSYDEVTQVAKTKAYDEEGNEVSPRSEDAVSVTTEMVVTKIVGKHEAPNVQACVHWLNNRRPEQWRSRHEVEHTGGEELVAMLNAGRDRVAALRKERENEQPAARG